MSEPYWIENCARSCGTDPAESAFWRELKAQPCISAAVDGASASLRADQIKSHWNPSKPVSAPTLYTALQANCLSTALTLPQENVQQRTQQWSYEIFNLGLSLKGLWKQIVGKRTEISQRDRTMHMNQAWTLSLISFEMCLSAYTWTPQTFFSHYH